MTDSFDGGSDALEGKVLWTPSKRAPDCRVLSMIQVARVRLEDGADLDWAMDQKNRNLTRTSGLKGSEQGFYVDMDASLCSKGKTCSPYYYDSYHKISGAFDGRSSQAAGNLEVHPVFIKDTPFGWTEFEKIELETCVVCRDSGQVHGCVKWGGSWPATGAKQILRSSADNHESVTFDQALKTFQDFYSPQSN